MHGSAWKNGAHPGCRLERWLSSSFLQAGVGGYAIPFLRSCRGTHPLGCSALPCFAAESTREGTLMSLPEGIATLRSSLAPHAEGRCSSSFCTIAFGEARRIFPPRLRRGTRHPDAPLPPCFVAESVRADTLRAHPENAAAPAQYPSTERRYRPNVTSGCPKRSEGGCPCRNEGERRPSTSQANKTANKYGNPGRVTIDDTPGIPVHY